MACAPTAVDWCPICVRAKGWHKLCVRRDEEGLMHFLAGALIYSELPAVESATFVLASLTLTEQQKRFLFIILLYEQRVEEICAAP